MDIDVIMEKLFILLVDFEKDFCYSRVEVIILELQIRIAFETAEMLEQLKDYYQETLGINFTKGDVITKAINDTYDLWKEAKWDNLDVNIKNYDLPQGALRPKLQISFEIEEKLIQLKRILTNYLELNKVITIGATIKYLLRLTINQIQKPDQPSVDIILFDIMNKYLMKDYSEETKKAINNYVDDVMIALEKDELI